MEVKVKLYRNLHKKGVVYSVQHKGKVIAYTSDMILKDVKFVVRKKGQEKVRASKRKNVHAFITGTMMTNTEALDELGFLINNYGDTAYYNPYTCETFVNSGKQPIHTAEFARVTGKEGKSYIATLSAK
jgi:hypothetical protein